MFVMIQELQRQLVAGIPFTWAACLHLNYILLISLRNAGQRTQSESGHFASVFCCSPPGDLGWVSEYGFSTNYQYYLCREKQINLSLQKYLTAVHYVLNQWKACFSCWYLTVFCKVQVNSILTSYSFGYDDHTGWSFL